MLLSILSVKSVLDSDKNDGCAKDKKAVGSIDGMKLKPLWVNSFMFEYFC